MIGKTVLWCRLLITALVIMMASAGCEKNSVYVEKGLQFLEIRDYDSAISQFDKAIVETPKNDLAYYYKAVAVCEKSGKFTREADDLLNFALNVNPKFSKVAGSVHLAYGWKLRYLKAEGSDAYRDRLGDLLYMELSEALEKEGLNPDALEMMAEYHATKGNAQEAETLLKMIVDTHPGNKPEIKRVKDYMNRLGQAIHSGRYGEAPNRNAAFAQAWYSLGWFYINDGNRKEGEKCFNNALGLDPDHVSARTWLAHYQMVDGQYEKAAMSLLALIERDRNNAQHYFSLSNAYYLLKNFEKSCEYYVKGLTIGTTPGPSHLISVCDRTKKTVKMEHVKPDVKPPSVNPSYRRFNTTPPDRSQSGQADYKSLGESSESSSRNTRKSTWSVRDYGKMNIELPPAKIHLTSVSREFKRPLHELNVNFFVGSSAITYDPGWVNTVLDGFTFLLARESWDYYWKVDIKEKKIYEIEGDIKDYKGQSGKLLDNAYVSTVKPDPNEGMYLTIKPAVLELDKKSLKMRLVSNDRMIIEEERFYQAVKIADKIYQFKPVLWDGIGRKANHFLQYDALEGVVYEMEGGKFGEPYTGNKARKKWD